MHRLSTQTWKACIGTIGRRWTTITGEGMPLPQSARDHLPHWYGYEGTALGRAIRDAGWRATEVNLTSERVTFVRDETSLIKDPEEVQQ